MSIGQLTPVPLREVWRHEAHNFTVWLSENLEFLADRLGMELTLIEREKTVGTFSVDIECKDENGPTVLIENQLEKTDHDHLGKRWPEIQAAMVDAMVRLHNALEPHIARL